MNIFMRFPEGKAKALTLSYDDGVRQDKRLVEILNRHGLKCTFNINSGLFEEENDDKPNGGRGRMTEKEAKILYQNSGHEVAVHALTHPYLETLAENAVLYEVSKDRENLERMFERPVRGMAYPFGTFNDQVVNCLKLAGIVYSRTTISSHAFDIPKDWLRLEATCHHREQELFELADRFLNMEVQKHPQLFYLWGHSYEFDDAGNWEIIERFAEKMGAQESIWYATNIEIYEYIEAYQRLVYTNDLSIVKNPTAITLYLEADQKPVKLLPGEIKKIKE